MSAMKKALANKKHGITISISMDPKEEKDEAADLDLAPPVEDEGENEGDEENEALGELLEYGSKELSEPAAVEAQEKVDQPMHEGVESELLPKLLAHHEGNDEKPMNTIARRAAHGMRQKLASYKKA